MTRQYLPDEVIAEAERIGEMYAAIPTPKELAAKAGCNVRKIQYHMRRGFLKARGVWRKTSSSSRITKSDE